MVDSNTNLKEIFQQGFNIFKKIETDATPANSEKFQANVSEAIRCLRTSTEMVNQLALFSTNEDLDDISTNNLRYLLLPVLLGDLYLKICTGERIQTVEMSKVYLLDFLETCRTYGIFQQDIKFQQSSGDSRAGNQKSLEDLASERQAKITRYKKLKEQEKQLQDLSTILQDSSVLTHDEELERKYYLLFLETWINKALEHISSINGELQILKHIERMKQQGENDENDEKSAISGSAMEQKKKQALPKPILIQRQIIQSNVFGAGYPSLPTMTQEEYFEKELREGKIVTELSDKLTIEQNESGQEKEEIDNREDEYLVKLKKDREWDDWKDDHRRGWGNRENMG